MKKGFLLCAMLFNIAFAQADHYKAAVINLKSGGNVNYALEGVSLSTQADQLLLSSPKAHAQWKLSDVASFEVKEVESVVTSAENVANFFVRFNAEERTLEVNNYTGRIDLFFQGGQLRKSFNVEERATIDLNGLPQALYVCVFRANGQTLKIVTK
ncbi:MAG: hypothetical protein MJZ30_03185 [Paludibacteraceae bacterium]|nr:hypothetical protein [Paludibacteraceae bacterium]